MMTQEKKALLAVAARMEDRMAFTEVLFDTLPAFKATSIEWDTTLSKVSKRKQGDRSKLNGAALVEEAALDLAKRRRRQLREDGMTWDDAWEQALREVAAILGLSPSTLHDWYRGKSRRKRKIRERRS